jgi:bacillithiol system protein YtxJ
MVPIKPVFSIQDAERLVELSREKIVVLYKHSPICSISETAIEQFEAFVEKAPADVEIFSVDVIDARTASRKIEELTGIRHESPQILVLSGGAVIWHASHRRVRTEEIAAQVAALT